MKRDEELELLERELAVALGTPLEELHARRALCPPLDLLRASAAEVLPDDRQAAVDEHLRACALCRALAADLQDDSLTSPAAGDARRVRSRIEAARPQKPPVRYGWMWRPALALAALALVAWFAWPRPRPAGAPPVAARATPAAIPDALRLEMPDLRIRASVALITRGGDDDARQYLSDLAPALNAYRSGTYGLAAREFAALEAKYPQAIEVFFYGGVSSLERGDGDAAVRALERARTLGEPEFAEDVGWYLGLAYHRTGNLEAARAGFAKLCASDGGYSTRACEAARATGGAR
jgi:hypothetical protein